MRQTKPIKQAQQITPGNPEFPFMGGVLALDLVNTNIFQRGKPHDFLTSPEVAAEWWRQATELFPERDRVQGEAETTRWTPTLLEDLKRLRVSLRHLFLALIEQHPIEERDLEELNRMLALGYQRVELNQAGELQTIYHTTESGSGAVLLPLALSALKLMTQSDRNRLHECASERCVGLFYDTTRSATRHWCSPECMNRTRSHQRYMQVKAQKRASEVLNNSTSQ